MIIIMKIFQVITVSEYGGAQTIVADLVHPVRITNFPYMEVMAKPGEFGR